MAEKITYLKRKQWDESFEEPAVPEWVTRPLLVVPVILVLNIAIFLGWTLFTGTEANERFFVENFLVSNAHLRAGYYWTVLTSVFSHNMAFHLLFNMMVLLSFGSWLERFLGKGRFLILYLGAGMFSSLMHCVTTWLLIARGDVPALGASGALAALLLVFAAIWPREKIVLFGLIPLPAAVGVGAFVVLDLWGLFAQSQGGGLPIGHGAHLGGTLFGAVYYFTRIRPRLKRLRT
ncbi:Rhomboid family intramembrane serine protease [Sulfidibacter corallicola]|uniref:Rhomboid family intramembrane serine protease n=1 Tax=Sulfidibacter corallicola TaxID=2818388 RepID=A0A8A4TLE9_SULCO|nr:rhomboid family intramembrane serine protease [Sulfidibacter corallicola]QTD50370.1 rhomboid family intramembrane serine protease [Sulfidibacter corallicola]